MNPNETVESAQNLDDNNISQSPKEDQYKEEIDDYHHSDILDNQLQQSRNTSVSKSLKIIDPKRENHQSKRKVLDGSERRNSSPLHSKKMFLR